MSVEPWTAETAAYGRVVGPPSQAELERFFYTVDRAAYVFCVLEQFHRHLLRRDIYATPSARWGDPRAHC